MRAFLIVLALVLSACSPASTPTKISACQSIEFEGSTFTDCLAEAGRDEISLVVDPQVRDLTTLADSYGKRAGTVRFAMNGGMYDGKGRPIGLAIVGGKQLVPLNRKQGGGNFHLLPNGVFSAETDGWHIRTSDAFAMRTGPIPSIATQSGPMLVIDGRLHPAIAPDGDSRYVRNAVGIDAKGNAHFVISERRVSFGLIARLLRDRLSCANALYLDGAVSALWDPASGRVDDTVPLGPLLVVERH